MSRLVVFTGAGISADSGLSVFRGKDGMWDDHKIEQVCNIRTWSNNFSLVHDFYNARRVQLGTVQPNAAHAAVARWQRDHGAYVISQNIDDLHERAGASDVLHVHGRLTEMRCVACGVVWEIGYRAWDIEADRCPKCNSRRGVKPNVVFFGEQAPAYGGMARALQSLGAKDLFVVIGTSGAVIPVGKIAREVPSTTVLSNLETDAHGTLADSDFDIVMHGRASETSAKLDAVVSAWRENVAVDDRAAS